MKILDRLPITERHSSLKFGDKFTTVHRNQILVLVSIDLAGTVEPSENPSIFPALLDTGNNLGFSVQDRQLREWGGIDPESLAVLGNVEINGQVVKRRESTAWLYPNVPGKQEAAVGAKPCRLRMAKGIAVYSRDAAPAGPRLPLLGLPAFLDNDLDWWLDPSQRNITVLTRTWRRSLIRLLCRL